VLLAAPQREASFQKGLDAAKASGFPLIVFAHGSDWCPHGERLKADIWDLEHTVDDVIFVAVDVREVPQETNTARNKGFAIKKVKTYPSLLAFAPDGTRLGLRAGATLPRVAGPATTVLRAFVNEVKDRVALQDSATAAQEAGDATAEVAALHAMLAQDLDASQPLLKRLQEVDPLDSTGVRRRAAFPAFHPFVAKATKAGQEGRGQDEVSRLQAMMDEGVYTDVQQAWIHNAMGSTYRYWEGHDKQAEAHFRQAAATAPDSVPGLAGWRLALKLYSDPTLEMGWTKRHMSDESTKWIVEDLPSPLKRGTYTVTFKWTRGRHGLDISEVRLLDGTRFIVKDAHEGFTGTAPRNNVYTLKVLWDLEHPVLRVTTKGSGGKDSQGKIVMEPVG
jgi:hypothetical protein